MNPIAMNCAEQYLVAVIDEAAKALRRRLGVAGAENAYSALECYQKQDCSGFYLHAGTAMEMSLKARLLEHGLLAIAPSEKEWFKNAMALMRNPDSPTVRTVGGREAVARLFELEPEIHLGLHGLVLETIDRWNHVKHLGLACEPSPEDLLAHTAAFLRVVNSLLKVDPEQFWGFRYPLVRELVAEELNAVGVRVAGKLAAARDRVRTLGPQAVEDLAKLAGQAIADSDDFDFISWAEHPCPVCQSPGRVQGDTIDDGEVDVEADKEGAHYYWAPRVVTIVELFQCDVCGLSIEGADELDTAGLPRRVDNERVDPGLLADLGDD